MKTQRIVSFLAGALFTSALLLVACNSRTEYIVSKDAPAQKSLNDIAAGAVAQAGADNASEPPTPQTKAVAANLDIAQAVLGTPSKASAKQALAISEAALKGQVADLQARLAKASATVTSLQAEAEKQKSDAYQKLQAEQEHARQVHNAFVSRCLQWAGIAFTLYAALFLFVTKFTGWSSVWPLPILSVSLWTLADFITSKWFQVLEYTTVIAAIIALGVYLWEEYRAATLTSSLSTLAAKAVADIKAELAKIDVGSLWSKIVSVFTSIVTWVKGLWGTKTTTATTTAPATPAASAAPSTPATTTSA